MQKSERQRDNKHRFCRFAVHNRYVALRWCRATPCGLCISRVPSREDVQGNNLSTWKDGTSGGWIATGCIPAVSSPSSWMGHVVVSSWVGSLRGSDVRLRSSTTCFARDISISVTLRCPAIAVYQTRGVCGSFGIDDDDGN